MGSTFGTIHACPRDHRAMAEALLLGFEAGRVDLRRCASALYFAWLRLGGDNFHKASGLVQLGKRISKNFLMEAMLDDAHLSEAQRELNQRVLRLMQSTARTSAYRPRSERKAQREEADGFELHEGILGFEPDLLRSHAEMPAYLCWGVTRNIPYTEETEAVDVIGWPQLTVTAHDTGDGPRLQILFAYGPMTNATSTGVLIYHEKDTTGAHWRDEFVPAERADDVVLANLEDFLTRAERVAHLL